MRITPADLRGAATTIESDVSSKPSLAGNPGQYSGLNLLMGGSDSMPTSDTTRALANSDTVLGAALAVCAGRVTELSRLLRANADSFQGQDQAILNDLTGMGQMNQPAEGTP